MSLAIGSRRALLSRAAKKIFKFNLDKSTLTRGMAKRATDVFEAAPIYQGDWDGAGTPDVVSFPRGDLLGNPTYVQYANFDPYQGSIVFWITPEWDGNDGLDHYIVHGGTPDRFLLYKAASSNLTFTLFAGVWIAVLVDASAWTAGTTYCVVARWDTKCAIDGTNYLSLSANNVHVYSGSTAPVGAPTIASDLNIGSARTLIQSADAIIEGLTIYRRVLYDGAYGKDVGNGDELALIYAAGTGVDPTTITGSQDVVFCQPTDSTAGAYASGTGEAWSHPLGSSVVRDWGMWEGKMPGGDWAVGFDGTTTEIDCGSDTDIDDIMDAEATVEAWIRADGYGQNNEGHILSKRSGSAGWRLNLNSTNGLAATVYCATTNATTSIGLANMPVDGKWHHIVMYFNDAGDRKIYLAVDGIWITGSQVAGVGAIQSDAAIDLYIGQRSGGNVRFDGAIAWAAISNNDRHAHGTDFLSPVAFPADDANYLASWNMEEGTGAAVANTGNQGGAGSGAANRDGTITSGSWESIWAREGMPVEPVALEFDGAATLVDCGTAADIDDIPDNGVAGNTGKITVDWIGRVVPGAGIAVLAEKRSALATGWTLFSDTSTGTVRFRVYYSTTNTEASATFRLDDDIIHHIACTYDELGDRKARVYIDGILGAVADDASVGNYVSDAAGDLFIGRAAYTAALHLEGTTTWFRFSDNIRYAADFTPVAWSNPPAPDGSTLRQFNFRDGTGLTLTDATGTANGTITLGSGQWLNTTDGELIEPGNRVYAHSMLIGSDAADDGIVIATAPTNPSDSVMLPVISYGQDGRAWPIIDFNGSEFKLPRLHDVHTGGAAAPLTNANGAFTQQLIDWELYNITQGTSGTITAIDGNGQDVTGGSPNFNNGDEYIIRPPSNGNYCDYPIGTFGIHVLRTAAAAVDMKVKNEAGEGTIQIHKVEVQESLLANGDHESLDGGFPGAAELITGWTNLNLDAGDTEPEAAIVHSAAQSLKWNAGSSGEGMYDTATTAVGLYLVRGLWSYGDGTLGFLFGDATVNRSVLQYDPATNQLATPHDAFWALTTGVWRATGNARTIILKDVGAVVGYTDDVYCFAMDPITLTVTPASEANSAEGTGIRVDGLDTLQQPIPVGYLRATEGHIRFAFTPRHTDADAISFGNGQAYVAIAQGDTNNYIYVRFAFANRIDMRFRVNGANADGNWASGGAYFVPGTRYTLDIVYTPSWARLYVNNIQRISVAPGFPFTTIPPTMYWGSAQDGTLQADIVIG